MAEPTVVHDKHIDTHFGGFVCERDKLIIVKIEICGLPAVDEHGAFHIAPRTFDEVLHVGAVENAAHLAEALIGVDHDGFRRSEGFVWLQAPGEIDGVDAREKACGVQTIHFGFNGKVAAVNEVDAVDFAVFFGGAVGFQCNERVVVV